MGGTTNGTGKGGQRCNFLFLDSFSRGSDPSELLQNYEKMIHYGANSFPFFLILTKGITPLLPLVEFLSAD